MAAVLHTFGSDLKRHVHIHVIISAGGLKLSGKAERYTRFKQRKQRNPKARLKKVSVLTDNPEWMPWTKFPYKMLQKRYQSLLIKHLKEQIDSNINSENPDHELRVFSDPAITKTFFDDLKKAYQNGFFVHITEEQTDLKLTAAYIGRYARRPPLSEIRIKNYTGEYISFEFKDYRDNASKVLYTLKTMAFIRKLVRHIPPHYFNVIRNYGLSASRVKTAYKTITDKLLGKASGIKTAKNWRERQTEFRGKDPLLCSLCQTVMVFVAAHIPIPLPLIKARLKSTFS